MNERTFLKPLAPIMVFVGSSAWDPATAQAQCNSWSYSISEEQCAGFGSDCLRRMGQVTNNTSEGPVQVGGTTKRNPYNPGACPPAPPKRDPGTAAYSSLGYDPNNPGNADKYGVKRIKPIEGWPGEWHLEIDGNLRAWRDSLLVRAHKAGAKTLEADNSDIPGYDLGKIAAQLNHECDMHRAFGEPCPLKNNPEILSQLNFRPEYWILETGQDNGGTKLIENARQSGIPPEAIFIVHYGPPSAEVCNLIPGAHVVFSKSKDLSVANLSPPPNSASQGTAPPPSPSSSGSAASCQAPEQTNRPYEEPQSPDVQPNYKGFSTAGASPSSPNAASRSPSDISRREERQQSLSPPPLKTVGQNQKLEGKKFPKPESTVTGEKLGDSGSGTVNHLASRRLPAGKDSIEAEFLNREKFGPGMGRTIKSGSSKPELANRNPANLSIPNLRGFRNSPSDPAPFKEPSDLGQRDARGAPNTAALNDTKLTLSRDELDEGKRKLDRDLSLASLVETAKSDPTGETLFHRIHIRLIRALDGGDITPTRSAVAP